MAIFVQSDMGFRHEAGVPRLPYREDLPDELEVDWGAKES